MDLSEALRQRRMVRSFSDELVEPELLDRLVDGARRAPSAGNTDGVAFVALCGPSETARYWDLTLPVERRQGFGWPGLLRAPVLVVVVVSAEAYVVRYAEDDKAATGLGESVDAWPVPYWHIDGGMAVLALLLGCTDAGLGACFFGLFAHEAAVLDTLGVPPGWRAVGTVAIGHPDGADRAGRSAARPRPPLDRVLHRGGWAQAPGHRGSGQADVDRHPGGDAERPGHVGR